jgi:hydroxymethylbilane synthase
MTSTPLRLGTRGSQLALYQAHSTAQAIASTGGPACEIVVVKTSGDRLQDAPLSEAGGKRLFVKELEDALLRREIDLAVHSAKDMPAVLPDGLDIAAVLPRGEPFDAVILPQPGAADSPTPETTAALVARLGAAPAIGTSSVRRVAQLLRVFPNARFSPIRGNLDTRLRKLEAGSHDALVVAAAGLQRLGLDARISFRLPLDICVPAPGQGIIAVEIRADDERTRATVARVTDTVTEAALRAERSLVEALGGGCQTPVGAIATSRAQQRLSLTATVISLDGLQAVRAHREAPMSDASGLGVQLASELLSMGAGLILEDARKRQITDA